MTSSEMGPAPRWSSPRRAERPTWGPRIGAVAKALGKPFMPWQQHVADIAYEVNPDTGRLAYREVRLLVPRQSGKSTLILAKSVWRMADAAGLGGRQRLIYTAQDRNKARDKFVEDYLEEIRGARALRGKWQERLSNGSEQIRWRNGSRWGIDAVKETSGHGATLDAGDIDEAFAHVDGRVEQAMRPTMATRPNAQLWVVSTAGTEASLYLNAKTASGRKMAEDGVDTGVAYLEWSADPDADPGDEATWWSCMPALGRTVTVDTIRADYLAMVADGDLSGFCRAYLNIQQDRTASDTVIDLALWRKCIDVAARPADAQPTWAVDVTPDRGYGALAVAYQRPDGVPQGEVVQVGPGTDWVVPALAELKRRHGRSVVVVDPSGPAGSLITDLERAGLTVVKPTARDMAQACGWLHDASIQGAWRHPGQTVLDDALKAATKRPLGDAWAWNRKRVTGAPIAPLVAVTLAVWGLRTHPARKASGFY